MSDGPLRIHIVTEEDPFYLPEFFREFFANLATDEFVVTGVDVTPPLNQKTPLALAKKLHGLYGSFDFLRLCLRYGVAKVKDVTLPTTAWLGTTPRVAARFGVPSSVVPNVNAAEYVGRLRELGIDLLISVAASQIFRKDLLSVPRLDAINIHTGTLPQYRGMLPVFWQMYDGQAEIGITIHTMTTEIDLGEILLQRRVPLAGRTSLDAVIREMKRQGARTMLEILRRYRTGTVDRTPMDRSREGYRSFPDRTTSLAFRRKGYRLL